MAVISASKPQKIDKNNRSTSRMKTYLSEGLRGRITIGRDSIPVALIDVSPFGIGIIPNTDLSSKAIDSLKPGSLVHFQYTSRHTSEKKLKAIVAHNTQRSYQGEDRLTVGLSFLKDESAASRSLRRRSERFACSEFFRPQAACASPFFFGEKAFLSLEDISTSGFSALTSARNKFLMPALEVKLTLAFPLIGTFLAEATIRAVTAQEKSSRYRIHFEFKSTDEALLAAIGEYLVMVQPDISIGELRKSGLIVSSLNNVISIKNPSCRDDWTAILELRKRIELQNGAPVRELDEYFDAFDAFARNTMIQTGSRLVATGRVVFQNGMESRSEIAQLLGNFTPPDAIRTHALEFSFPAIEPEYQRSDVLDTVMRSYFKIALENKAAQVLCLAPEHQKEYLVSLGFQASTPARNISFRGRHTSMILMSQSLGPIHSGQRPEGITKERFDSVIQPILTIVGIETED
jgi:hypothetical protein